ncbi:diguanylate cyclase domain-containing protein [Azonexus sp.]|uniref:diguanylate cyclase domain-containing protein n=1 Tax=Azonexus sp. TaxID=1872668 RepID=UPI0027BA4C2C|nr:diguanylate cyclase [Azonexus sp.]
MNNATLRQRLLLLTLLPGVLITAVLVLYYSMNGISALETELRAKGLSTVRYLAPISEYGIISGQMDSIYGLVQAAIQEPGVKAAIIVNQRGRTLAVSGRISLPADIIRQQLTAPQQVAESKSWIAFGAPVIRTQNDKDPLFDFVGPEDTPQETIGHVFVELDKEELAARQRELLQRSLVIVLLGLGLMAAFAIFMADRLAQPLQRLARAVRSMSTGHFDTRVPTLSTGELRVLEEGFNDMAAHIEEAHRSMQTRIEEATAQLLFQARHDALTGLANRREFELRLDKALAGVHAGGAEFSVLYIDLDRFKTVNDACGHLAGDELLRQISLLFQGRLREEDTLGRLGGDEFGILLANCQPAKARQIADELCALAAEYRFVWQDKIFAIGASIGIAPVTREVRDTQEILSRSDAACLQAKEQGRNQVCEPTTQPYTERRKDHGNWASRLSSALAEGRLIVEAIPIRALQAELPGSPIAELTARLNEPGQPPIALNALIDAAERYDMASTFDHHFLETAINALARTAEHQRPMRCLLPLSRNAISSPKTGDFIASQLGKHGIAGDGLYLMFSEEISTHHTSQIIEFSRRMRELGCQIVLTEFGGGISSFSLLRTIGPSHVRLSSSLTRGIGDGVSSTALLRAILEIAAEQRIYSIAQEADDTLLLDQLRRLGVAYAHGKAVAPREPFDAWFEGAVMRGRTR